MTMNNPHTKNHKFNLITIWKFKSKKLNISKIV